MTKENLIAHTDVAITDMADMMAPTATRSMPMKGFDDEFIDIADYIVRITSWIWDNKDPEVCTKYYSDDCPIHTMAGEIHGVENVINGTRNTLTGFPDRTLDAINVVWAGDENEGYHSSHLITSEMTNLGPSEFGPPTGKKVRFHTVADCLCFENKIIEEWLMRDNLAIVNGLGLDAEAIATEQAQKDLDTGDQLSAVHQSEIDRILAEASSAKGSLPDSPENNPEDFVHHVMTSLWQEGNLDLLPDIYDFRAETSLPDNKRLYGRHEMGSYISELRDTFTDGHITVDHIGHIPYMGIGRDIAVRWSFTGIHSKDGPYGPATNMPVRILASTHWRIIKGRIHREWTIFDEVALMRQIITNRLR